MTLEIFLDGEESVVIRHGKRSPRRGIYSSIDYEDGPYVFAFPSDMLEKLMLLSELRQIYQSP
ncbi:MAG: hypothetical protein LR011_13610 [Verrucomicrobia bacterium]|nr:hypothetical protein [Verrucomicrobiota bacterium]